MWQNAILNIHPQTSSLPPTKTAGGSSRPHLPPTIDGTTMNKRSTIILIAAFALLSLGLAACGDDHDHEDGTHDHDHDDTGTGEYAALAMEACTLAEGSHEELTAASDADGAADITVHPGKAYQVTIPEGGIGYVTFHSTTEHTDQVAFTDAENAITTIYDDGEIFETPSGRSNVHCSETLAGQYTIHLHEMKAYTLELTGSGTIWLSILSGATGHGGGNNDTHNNHTATNNANHNNHGG